MRTKAKQMMPLIICILFTTIGLHAQQISTRYGKVTNEELEMTTYLPDTAANAVVIFHKGETRYDYVQNGFRITSSFEKKIKILKTEGAKYADIVIPFYSNESELRRKESIISIDAVAYNMENGKVERTKMKSEYVFRERVNSNYMQVKFSIPAVKAGTVIEYKYKLLSDYISSIDPWEVQEEIPVMFSQYDIVIPEYFKFNLDMRGGVKVQTEDKTVPLTISLGNGELLRLDGRNMIFTANNVPSLKADSYVWCPEDYTSRINFELHGVQFPHDIYRSFTSTWEKIDEQLLEYEEFGKLLRMKNPFQAEVSALPLGNLSTDEKISLIHVLLKQKMSWNKKYAMYATDIKKAIKEGTGTNAELNFVFMSMLRDAGIQSVPLVMSRRSMGFLPLAHPTMSKLNTMIVGIQNSDTTMVYLDGSVEHGYINTLPPVLMTNQARVISKNPGNKWVDLTNLGKSQLRVMSNIVINEDGSITGDRKASYIGQYAAEYRQKFKDANNMDDFIEKLETKHNLKTTNFKHEKLEAFSPDLTEEFTFEKTSEMSGDYIYLNPFIFKHISENPFTQEQRQLPVEFPYAHTLRIMNSITIPEGFEIEELPKGQSIKLNENDASCRYLVQQSDNKIVINYTFSLQKTFFVPNEYEQLRTMYITLSERNNEMIVLKRKSE
ncbi:DUF3857 domain-containing protein [Bacteroides sp. 519]|uniref:DUF3857 domain-containing protein n=1 Tax=Bacteroides sp. 519 TaxID=2302937 RepID=UPI0013D7EAE2|nr:DUF3857 domain-containing protein [Bacteroides sp. 519]NDV57574.1 DUF3857 domain-containing protein [Bacteroides sp. 519]